MWYDVAGVLILNGSVWPRVDAHRRGEALDRRVARAVDLPVAGRIPGSVFSQAITLVPHGVEVGVAVAVAVAVGVAVAIGVGVGVGPVPVWNITSTQ